MYFLRLRDDKLNQKHPDANTSKIHNDVKSLVNSRNRFTITKITRCQLDIFFLPRLTISSSRGDIANLISGLIHLDDYYPATFSPRT